MSDAEQVRSELAHELTRLRALRNRATEKWLLNERGAFWTAQLLAGIVEAAEYTAQRGGPEEQLAALDFIRGLK